MAAYAAVASLLQTLDTILHHPGGLRISHSKSQLRSLHRKVSILLNFLENSSSFYGKSKESELQSLETKIRNAAQKAQDVIECESYISNQLPSKVENTSYGVSTRVSFLVLIVNLVGFILNPNLIHVAIPKPVSACIHIFISVILKIPFPFGLALLFVSSGCLTSIILIPILTLIKYVFQGALLKVILFVRRYVLYLDLIVNLVGFILNPNLIHVAIPKPVSACIHIFISVILKISFPFGLALLFVSFCCLIFIILISILTLVKYVFQAAPLKVILFVCRYVLYLDLRPVMGDISSISKEVLEIMDACSTAGQGPRYQNVFSTASSSRRDSGGSRKNAVVGFDNGLKEIRNGLASNSSKIEIVSIVGMGGIGKTTLARQVYDDGYIKEHFYIRAWVTISQDYSLRQVLQGLLDSAGILMEKMSEKTEDQLSVCLYQSLIGRRYLIVMDDMWDTKLWDEVKRSFPEDNNGSRVVLTTRLSEVALYPDSCGPLHQMRLLNPDESWNLLRNIVFGEKDCPYELEEIGKEIGRNCEGLPLAIAVTGGLLSKVSETTENWRKIADNTSSVVSKDDERCMEILSLSYSHLPHRLRACFLYLGIFPEDYEIPVAKLICLWAAEGFLRPSTSKSLEELAEAYLEDLIKRNLILVCKRSPNSKIKTCKIHDLLWNLCKQKATAENFFGVMDRNGAFRRVVTTYRTLRIHNLDIHVLSGHSVPYSGARREATHMYLFNGLLRVLDLTMEHFARFPYQIIEMVHLRYLAFTYDGELPPSISKLWNLQTLVHRFTIFGQGRHLPVEIWMMPNLRHLCVTTAYLPDPPVGNLVNNSFLLENLHTLSGIRNFNCHKHILRRIPNLKQLEISYDVSPSVIWSAYRLKDLLHLRELETLKLHFKNPCHTTETVNSSKLAFPRKLKKLTLSGCGVSWESMMNVGALEKLEVLKLKRNACQGAEWKPADKQFPNLKYLLLEEIDLFIWEADETHFPLLEHLVIRSCCELKVIPSGIGEIPKLQMIELVHCHPSAVTSAKELQKNQENMGNEGLKVHVELKRRLKNKFYSLNSD